MEKIMAERNEIKTAVPAPKRDRSPNYPCVGPTEALRYAEMIWKHAKRNPVSVDMACRHMGYKAQNGASLPIVGALRKYGLLVRAGAEMRISDEANTIFLAPAEHPTRTDLVRKLAMRPVLFRVVLARFPDGLTSDADLRFRLQNDWKFANVKAADNFILALKDAMGVAGIASGSEIADNGSENDGEEADTMTQNTPIVPPTPSATGRLASPSAPQAVHVRSWDLGGGSIVSLQLPAKLSKGNIEKLKRYVGALEAEAAIAWDDDATP
jgi:hypothetical protein